MVSTTDSKEPLDQAQRSGRQGEDNSTGKVADSVNNSHNQEEEEEGEMDQRASKVELVPQYVDMADADLQAIMAITLKIYNTYVLVPTRNTWRKDEGSRRELEREVERTAVSDMTRDIKKAVDAQLGGCWHAVYGRDFGTYVSHKTQSFCHFQLDGANVVVWRHGM